MADEALHPDDAGQRTYILVTGCNSGVGFAICQRLIDEFINSRPAYQSLTLIVTTRTVEKSKKTVNGLQRHLSRKSEELETPLSTRVTLQPENLDLSSLYTVNALSDRLQANIPHLDAIVLNAGAGGLIGLDWAKAIWSCLTEPIQATTYPSYKVSSRGELTLPQRRLYPEPTEDSSTAYNLGQIFTSNVLGHYILAHLLTPLLTSSPDNGRIIFTSSLEAYPFTFSPSDVQALQTHSAYESSKRLTDLLVLTSSLPSTKPFTSRFLSPSTSPPPSTHIALHDNINSTPPPSSSASTTSLSSSDDPPETEKAQITLTDHTNPHTSSSAGTPALLLAHPGICATSFFPLPLILQWAMQIAFYIARWLGSPWHTITAYKGAVAPVWLALASREEIEDLETEGGKGKWGSGCDWRGRERVERTGVGGWGIGGRVGESGRMGERGRLGGKEDVDFSGTMGKGKGKIEAVTREAREEFEETGRECWRQMEELRVFWEGWVLGEED